MRQALFKLIVASAGYICCAFFIVCCGCNDNEVEIEVPSDYQELYESLEATLDTLHADIDQQWDGTLYPDFIPMASVLPANSNLGESLLQDGKLDFVKLYITRLREMGCKGVQLDIQFPILDPDYFAFAKAYGLMSQDSPDDTDYLAYYKAVVQEIRKQGLSLSIESQVVFTQATWSPFPVAQYYLLFNKAGEEGLATYVQRKQEQLKLIVTELAPDYLTIGDEPETEMSLTGIALLQDKDRYLEMIREIVETVRPLAGTKTLLGSGYGTWSHDWKYWTDNLNGLNIDFINIHIYSIDTFSADPKDTIYLRTLTAADTARSAGKRICLGETWLYKQGRNDANDPEIIYGRDYFDFWQPLDLKHLSLMLKIAHYKQFDFVSPFWSTFFFSYLTYDEAKDLSTADRKSKNNLQAAENVYKAVYSDTGTAYSDMIQHGPQ